MLSILARRSTLIPLMRLPVSRAFASSSIRLLASTTTATKERAAKTTANAKAKSTSTSKSKPKATSKSAAKPKPKPKPKPKAKAIKKAPKPELRYKNLKEHLPPRRPMSAFMLFAQEERAQRTITSREEAMGAFVAAGKAWRALSDSEKEVYYARSVPGREAYKVQYAEWADKVDPTALKVINDRRAKSGKFKYRRHSETPRAQNPFLRVLKEMTQEHPSSEAPPGEKYISWISKQAAERWKRMGDSEKAKYQEEFEAEKEKRQAEIDARA